LLVNIQDAISRAGKSAVQARQAESYRAVNLGVDVGMGEVDALKLDMQKATDNLTSLIGDIAALPQIFFRHSGTGGRSRWRHLVQD
jgi:hypothetical protein